MADGGWEVLGVLGVLGCVRGVVSDECGLRVEWVSGFKERVVAGQVG
jgi:hypothetical protein